MARCFFVRRELKVSEFSRKEEAATCFNTCAKKKKKGHIISTDINVSIYAFWYVSVLQREELNRIVLISLNMSTKHSCKHNNNNKGSCYYYFIHFSSRDTFFLRYYSGCSLSLDATQGVITSPAFGIKDYPSNQECRYLLRRPGGGPLSLKVGTHSPPLFFLCLLFLVLLVCFFYFPIKAAAQGHKQSLIKHQAKHCSGVGN